MFSLVATAEITCRTIPEIVDLLIKLVLIYTVFTPFCQPLSLALLPESMSLFAIYFEYFMFLLSLHYALSHQFSLI